MEERNEEFSFFVTRIQSRRFKNFVFNRDSWHIFRTRVWIHAVKILGSLAKPFYTSGEGGVFESKSLNQP